MSRFLIAVLISATAFSSTQAFAQVSERSPVDPSVQAKYLHRYHKVAARHGHRAPGRNIVKYGIAFTWTSKNHKRSHRGVRNATTHEVAVSARQLMTILKPPGPLLSRTVVPPPRPPAGVRTASVKANLPSCTWVPESGGDYNAVNPSSGAYGKYQIMPSHWSPGSVCYGMGKDPAGQERCAVAVYKSEGAGAWVNC